VIHRDAVGEGHVRRQARVAEGTRRATLWVTLTLASPREQASAPATLQQLAAGLARVEPGGPELAAAVQIPSGIWQDVRPMLGGSRLGGVASVLWLSPLARMRELLWMRA
jgi:hypothetical protein